MKNLQKIIVFVLTISLLGCNFNADRTQTNENSKVEISKSDLKRFVAIFKDLKEYLAKENGNLWNHKLYGAILLVDEKNRIIIANEPDSNNILSKNGNVYTGILTKEINIANTAIDWNGKIWTMLMLPLPNEYQERI
jgi:hypothetical protein